MINLEHCRLRRPAPNGRKLATLWVHLLVAVSLVFFLTACTPTYTAKETKFSVRYRKQRTNVLAGEGLSDATQRLLRLRFLDDDYAADPEAVVTKLEKEFLETQRGSTAAVVAELAYLHGRNLEEGNDLEGAAAYYTMATAYCAEFYLGKKTPYTHSVVSPLWRFMAELYNIALSRLVVLWQKSELSWSDPWELKTPRNTFILNVNTKADDAWPPDYFDQLRPALAMRGTGLINEYFLPGLGAPLIGLRENEPGTEDYDPWRPDPVIVMPVTALIDLEGRADESASRRGSLSFFDPLRLTTVEVDDQIIPLEVDLSTTFALFLSRKNPGSEDFSRMRRPDLYMDKLGIDMLNPYDPEKIPVLMVHGLYSSPATFVQMFNDLTGAKDLREHYQFWFFQYPTGLPIIYSSARLREKIKELRKQFDPQGDNPAFNKMVVIGHSMGGILSKTLIQSAGTTAYDMVFSKPIDQLEITDDERRFLESLLFFEPMPFVKRVVFVATPHRGSALAATFVGKVGRKLISLPGYLDNRKSSVMRKNKDAIRERGYRFLEGSKTSVHQLSPRSAVLQTQMKLPLASGVPYHSIIGVRRATSGPGSSDGIVPYESSHLDGATSEMLIPYKHECLQHPLTIAEIKRILRLHLKELGKDE